MSTAMRSTLQTVPESLEVTKPSATTQDAPATAPTKTPAKASGEAVATKGSRSYNYHAPSSTNKPITIRNQMMRLLRRSKSTATAHTDKTTAKTPPGHHQTHHHYHHNHVVHPQHNRNGGMVVNMVEGLPLVVGGGIGGKSKKVLGLTDLAPFGLNLLNQVTRVDCVPKTFVYNEAIGLRINWKISDVSMLSKIVEGPFAVKHEENETCKKLRYNVIFWPEMIYKPTSDIWDCLLKCIQNGTLRSLIHLHSPPLDQFKKMEDKAAKIYYKRKMKKGGDNPAAAKGYTTFKLGELGDGATFAPLQQIDGFTFKIFSKIFKRSVRKLPKRYREAAAEGWRPRAPNPDEMVDAKKCMKVVGKKSNGCYLSEFWPWFLVDADLKKPFWKRMHRIMGYKKLKLTTLTCDLNLQDYKELRKIREAESHEMLEKFRAFLTETRGL